MRPLGFAYDILIHPKQLPAAIDLVAQLSEQHFVIDHCAKPEIKARNTEPWAAHMRTIAQNQNVFCKVSGLVTEADWKLWKADDFKPYLDVVFDAFGPDRLMFGSDWPVCLAGCDISSGEGTHRGLREGFLPGGQEKDFRWQR